MSVLCKLRTDIDKCYLEASFLEVPSLIIVRPPNQDIGKAGLSDPCAAQNHDPNNAWSVVSRDQCQGLYRGGEL